MKAGCFRKQVFEDSCHVIIPQICDIVLIGYLVIFLYLLVCLPYSCHHSWMWRQIFRDLSLRHVRSWIPRLSRANSTVLVVLRRRCIICRCRWRQVELLHGVSKIDLYAVYFSCAVLSFSASKVVTMKCAMYVESWALWWTQTFNSIWLTNRAINYSVFQLFF